MADTGLVALRNSVTGSVQRMSGTQRTTLALAFVGTSLAIFVVTQMAGRTPMRLLYADLDPSAAASIVDELDAQGVNYELGSGGRSIMVPADQVYSLRLDLSSQNLPSSSEGWSVLENQGITTSEFDQKVGYQRAMEGELAQTITAINGVSAANVHLVIPEDDLFVGDDVAASASVLVTAGGSTPITSMQVEAIVNLVASSVEGLTTDRVTVADESGRVLAAPGDGGSVAGLEGDNQLRTRNLFEANLEADIENLLTTVVGRGLAVVNVTAELSFDSVQTVSEQYQPSRNDDGDQTVASETTRTETYRNANIDPETGVLGTEVAEQQDVAGADDDESTQSTYDLNERDATFVMNKTTTSAETSPGRVEALSVAVLLDEEAVDAARVAEIEDLVSAAAGINRERGDTIAVSLLPINGDIKAEIEAANSISEQVEGGGLDLVALIRTIGSILVALVVVVFGLKMLRANTQTEVVESIKLQDEPEDKELEPGAETSLQPELVSASSSDAPNAADDIHALLDNQPEEMAGALRSWLDDTEQG